MPRHRKERVPRRGACPRTQESPGHASLSAARSQPEAGEQDGVATVQMTAIGAQTCQPADPVSPWEAAAPAPGDPDRSQQSGGERRPSGSRHAAGSGRPASSRHTAGSRHAAGSTGAAGSRRPPRGAGQPGGPAQPQGMLQGAARGLLVNPWFAAGTGFVVAAGMWIYAPHASLHFSIANPRVPDVTTQPGGTPGNALGKGKQAGGSTRAGTAGTKASRSAASGLTFRFNVLWQQNGAFAETFTITSKHAIERWQLSFKIPGAKITRVVGGSLQWLPHGRVIVSPYHPQANDHDEPNGGMPGGGDSQYGVGLRTSGSGRADNGKGRHQRHEVTITVFGTGSPGQPTDCSFNGASCTFSD